MSFADRTVRDLFGAGKKREPTHRQELPDVDSNSNEPKEETQTKKREPRYWEELETEESEEPQTIYNSAEARRLF